MAYPLHVPRTFEEDTPLVAIVICLGHELQHPLQPTLIADDEGEPSLSPEWVLPYHIWQPRVPISRRGVRTAGHDGEGGGGEWSSADQGREGRRRKKKKWGDNRCH